MANNVTDSSPYVSILNLNGTAYTIKDAWARAEIADIETAIAGGVHFRGVTVTAIQDGESLKQLNVGTAEEPDNIPAANQANGDIFIYNDGTSNLEFIVSNGKYSELGSTGALGSLAFADTAVGSTTVPIASAMTFNTFTPDVGLGTLSVTTSAATLGVTTTASSASGTFSPAAFEIAPSDVTFTPTTDTFTALQGVTYDSTTATLSISNGTSGAFWTSATGKAAGQTVTPTANQSISVTYDKATGITGSALASAALDGSLAITGAKPTATITDPVITVTVSPVSD